MLILGLKSVVYYVQIEVFIHKQPPTSSLDQQIANAYMTQGFWQAKRPSFLSAEQKHPHPAVYFEALQDINHT